MAKKLTFTQAEEAAMQEINSLSEEIEKHNKLYYLEESPIISDAAYDQLFQRLQKLEQDFPQLAKLDSPTQKVGAIVQDKFHKYQHKKPMLSLANCFSETELLEFIQRTQRFLTSQEFPAIFCEPKIDGVSFSLIYENGRLAVAATRGDGYVGENITANIKTIEQIPLIIDTDLATIEVRGEIFIEKNDFITLNQEQEKANRPSFANPRNCASGSLRQLDVKITASRPLKYFIYATGYLSGQFAQTQQETLTKLAALGFQINPEARLATNIETILEFYKQLADNRNNLPYEIDGVVYKINDFALQERLGFIARSPRFAIAHKFPAILATTILRAITVQVGRTGSLTPVAELEPVMVGGTKIARATLHNFQEIDRLDIRIGDRVILHRAGDVIPKITQVELEKRPANSEKYLPPTHCPSCHSLLHFTKQEVIIRCDNGLNCPAQLGQSIKHFVAKNALNIEGLGEKQIEFFIAKKLIKNPVDIFHLEELDRTSLQKIAELPGFGKKSVQNLFTNINRAKKTTLPKFIYALGIRQIGEMNARLLSRHLPAAELFLDAMLKLAELSSEEGSAIAKKLVELDGIGEKILFDLKGFFACSDNVWIVQELVKILDIEPFREEDIVSILAGQNIVFTGTLTNLSRSEAKEQATKLGAKIVSNVSANTDLLVAGEKAGSKLKKATELGVKIISQAEWAEIVSKGGKA